MCNFLKTSVIVISRKVRDNYKILKPDFLLVSDLTQNMCDSEIFSKNIQ